MRFLLQFQNIFWMADGLMSSCCRTWQHQQPYSSLRHQTYVTFDVIIATMTTSRKVIKTIIIIRRTLRMWIYSHYHHHTDEYNFKPKNINEEIYDSTWRYECILVSSLVRNLLRVHVVQNVFWTYKENSLLKLRRILYVFWYIMIVIDLF